MPEGTGLPHVTLATKSNGEVLQTKNTQIIHANREPRTQLQGRIVTRAICAHSSCVLYLTCSPLFEADRTGELAILRIYVEEASCLVMTSSCETSHDVRPL